MQTLLRSIRLLSLVIWVGGIAFFAFVLAPVAFRVLPNVHEAGLVVGGALPILNKVGFGCGLLFLLATRSSRPRQLAQSGLILLMLALTLYLDQSILPRMERDRASVGGDITLAAPGNPARADFDRLHPLSERLEGIVLLAGIVAVILYAAERTTIVTPQN